MRTVDRIFGWLMLLGAAAHFAGSVADNKGQPLVMLWSLGTGLAELLLGAMNLVRAQRRHDLVLALLCVAGNVAWIALVVAAFVISREFRDPILWAQLVVTLALLSFSVRARRRSRPL